MSYLRKQEAIPADFAENPNSNELQAFIGYKPDVDDKIAALSINARCK